MSREWKPGQVAMIHIPKSSAPGYLVTEPGSVEIPAVRNAAGGWSALSNPDYFWGKGYAFHKSDPRPLVVIDPESDQDVERLRLLYGAATIDHSISRPLQAALREFADPKPPKPEEPMGLGAVVEDAKDCPWVRGDRLGVFCWTNGTEWRRWDEIDAVKVLSEGVR